MTAMISLQQIEKRYPGTATPAVDGLSLDIAEGETVALVGPSGCGKTTTLKMINRLIEPTGGPILVDGTDVCSGTRWSSAGDRLRDPEHRPDAAPHDPPEHRHRARSCWAGTTSGRARIEELVDIFDLDPELLGRYPAELSGGQRQRVGVARALAADPP